MSVVRSNLGWYADSEYLSETAGEVFGVISGRNYQKGNNSDACIVYLRNYPQDYHQALTISTTADGAKQDGFNVVNYKWTVTIDGVLWYVNTGDYGFKNGTWTTANFPLLTDISINDITADKAGSIRTLLQRAGVSFGAYTVHFAGNGATSGTMADQVIPLDTATPLNANQFVRASYVFLGWSTTYNGEVEYTNEEVVTNLGAADETVTLYAIWRAETLNVILQRNASDSNHVDKSITNMVTLSGYLKQPTSILNPVLIVSGILDYVATANYMTIPKFGNRSYYITEIKSIRNNLIEIHGKVDVLYTYRAILRQQTAIVHRQESRYNLYLNDGVLKFYQNPHVVTQEFPKGFSGSSPNLVLVVAGGGGNPST